MLQWGNGQVVNGGNWFNFPITHRTVQGKIVGMHWYEGGWAVVGTLTGTAFHVDAFYMSYVAADGNKTASFVWMSIGY